MKKSYPRPKGFNCACCKAADLIGCSGPECRHHPEYEGKSGIPSDEHISTMAGETWEDYGRL